MPLPPTSAVRRQRPIVLVLALVVVTALLASSCSELFPSESVDDSGTRIVGRDWIRSTPTRAGFEGETLVGIIEDLGAEDTNIHRILAAKDGLLALDANLYPAPSRGRQDLGSLTTSVVALVVLVAIERGDIDSLDTRLGSLLDLPRGSAAADVPLRDLLGMRAGLDCARADGEPQLAAMLASSDYVAAAAAIQRAGPPGRTFAFCSPTYHLLSAAITAVTGESMADYAADVLFDPLSIDSWIWPTDDQGITHGWADLQIEPRDLARIGQLVLDDGIAFDQRLLPRDLVATMREDAIEADGRRDYSLGWWLPAPVGDTVPLEARAEGGQSLLIDDEQGFFALVMGAGADAGTWSRRLAEATRPRAIPDLASDKRIAEELERLEVPPIAGAAPGPGGAARIGTTIRLERNRWGIQSMLVLQAGAVAEVTLMVDDQRLALSVPLDGVPRVAQLALGEGPAALVGNWDGTTLRIDHESIEGTAHLVLDLNIGPDASMHVTNLNSSRPPTRIGYL